MAKFKLSMTRGCPNIDDIKAELQFTTSRSGGPGGQGVNKVNTKVTLRWDVSNSHAINQVQRERILKNLDKVINNEGEVVLMAQTSRSQLQNKEEVINKLTALIKKVFTRKKPRKSTKPTKASVQRRLAAKKRHGEKKKQRKGLD